MARRLFFRFRVSKTHGNPVLAASLGIALSLIPLITVEHVAEAMIEGIVARYREISTFHFQIHPWEKPEADEWVAMESKTRDIPSVKTVWIERRGWGLVRSDADRTGVFIRALPADMPDRDPVFDQYLDFYEGSWNLDEPNSILLGREVAYQLKSSVGEEILILATKRFANGTRIPRVVRLTVRGIFTSGYKDLDANWVFIPLRDGWEILSAGNTQTFLGGKLVDSTLELENIDAVIPSGWKTFHWRDINAGLMSNLESTRVILLIVMGLVIIVAVFNILNSLLMLALERKKEIGTLKCFGVKDSTIILTFVLVGSIAAVCGSLMGGFLGVSISYFINQFISFIELVYNFFSFSNTERVKILAEGHYLQYIPIRINWRFVLVTCSLTCLTAIMASMAPAFRVARLKPLEVLRKH